MGFMIGAPRLTRLVKWVPKRTVEDEKRLLLLLEMPLTDEILQVAPNRVQRASEFVAKIDNGAPELPVTDEFTGMNVEVYLTPDNISPFFTLTNVTIRKLLVFRAATSQEPTEETFLQFSINTGTADSQMVSWALEHYGKDIFLQFHHREDLFTGPDSKSAAANDKEETEE